MSDTTQVSGNASAKTDSPYAIEVKNVFKSFNGFQVLKGINLNVRRGKTRVILGPSGSGKTVIMKHMIGLLKPDRGEILIDGQDITKLGSDEMLGVRRKFGMVFQQAALFDSMNVGDNVAFPLREHTDLTPDAIADMVKKKLAVVDLKDIEQKFPSELSGGMRKRVGLARAIVLEPSIVLYDEPTTGLDPLTTDSVDKMIMDASKRLEVTSVVISHDVGSALLVADDIAVIHEGVIVEDCLPSEIRDSQHPFVKEYLHTWFRKQ
ncbi:MAG: ABC transporter ATP-binding protein [Clostridia bacterium]|nr:ABC transporter ATP-binding protein [Deltaproteobacteria bacterium]